MPVTYQIDRALGLVRTKCAGEVTLEEVLAHFNELRTDSNRPPRFDVLVDMTESLTAPTSEEILTVSREVAELRAVSGLGACAIVVNRDVLFGMARVFTAFTRRFFKAMRVFRDRAEAEAWLAEKRKPAG